MFRQATPSFTDASYIQEAFKEDHNKGLLFPYQKGSII